MAGRLQLKVAWHFSTEKSRFVSMNDSRNGHDIHFWTVIDSRQAEPGSNSGR